jgi:catechol 2,3-dioxygenase-like lactoylglutathione lyase family enzyme
LTTPKGSIPQKWTVMQYFVRLTSASLDRDNESCSNSDMTQTIATITILVDDYDQAIEFYCDAVGFNLVEDTDMGDGKRWILVAPAGQDGAQILLAKASDEAQKKAVGLQTGGRVSFFLHTNNFSKDHAAMVARGVKFLEEPRHEDYGSVAVFQDLYGNKWDFIEPKKPAR